MIRGVVDRANRHDNQLYLLLTDISEAFDSVSHNAIERGANAMFTVLRHLKVTMHPDKLELYVRCKNDEDDESNTKVAGRLVPARERATCFRALGLYPNLKGATERQLLHAWDKAQQVTSRLWIIRSTTRQIQESSTTVSTQYSPTHQSSQSGRRTGWTVSTLTVARSSNMDRRPWKGSLRSYGWGPMSSTQTAWFALQMFQGMKNTETHSLFHDTLEDIKQHQTFQDTNVYQSGNRLEEVNHSHVQPECTIGGKILQCSSSKTRWKTKKTKKHEEDRVENVNEDS